MATSQKVSVIASKGLKNPGSLNHTEIKKVCASALAQDEVKSPRKPRKVKPYYKQKYPRDDKEQSDVLWGWLKRLFDWRN